MEARMDKEFKSFFKKVGGNEGGKCHYPTRLEIGVSPSFFGKQDRFDWWYHRL